jgi:plastocyanin
MRVLWPSLALILAFSMSGCNATTSTAAQEPVQTDHVEMPPSYRLVPPVIQVKAGTAVTWHNSDNFTHDIHLGGETNWVSEPLHPGMSASYTFAQPGKYPYVCDFHSQVMKGQVIVVAP